MKKMKEKIVTSQEPEEERFAFHEESQKGSTQPSAMSLPVFGGHIHGTIRNTQGIDYICC